MARKSSSVFCHPLSNFTKQHIKSVSKDYDILYKDNLESHIWVYELYSQIQKRCGNNCVLKGGASAQLFLPLNLQRLTKDIDCATDLSPKELFNVMHSIKNSYMSGKFYTNYKEYIPKRIKREGHDIPMMTFIYDIPFQYQTKMKTRYPGLKIDFLFLDTKILHKTKIEAGETLGLKLNYTPIIIDKYSTISDKLLTLAFTTLGLETYKLDALYKNIFDLSCLLKVCNDFTSFKIISERIEESLQHEIEMKNGKKVRMKEFLEDVLSTLFNLSLTNMSIEYNNILPTLKWFGEQYFQEKVRDILTADLWSILCLHLYIWTYALMTYTLSKNYSPLNGINIVLDELDYFISLDKKGRRKHKAELKRRIIIKEPGLNVDATGSPLRLMYLDYILTYCKI